MKINIIAFTQKGYNLAKKLGKLLNTTEITVISKHIESVEKSHSEVSLDKWVSKSFQTGNALIFIGSAGVAVRSIAPYIKSKTTDPAVIVIDEHGKNVVPILSGHIGGANELAYKIANLIKAEPIITTATDINNIFAIDVWAKKAGYHIVNPEKIKQVSAALLAETPVGLLSDYPIDGKISEKIYLDTAVETGIYIGSKAKQAFKNTLMLVPKNYIVGVGCRKNIDVHLFESEIISCLKKDKIDISRVKTITSIDIKANEKAIIQFANKYNLNMKFFDSNDLLNAKGAFASSDFVESVVGVGNVCERACSLLGDEVVMKKKMLKGVTAAVSIINWRVTF